MPDSAALRLTDEECLELLSAYADRELTPQELAAVEAHLANNPELATESKLILNMKQLITNWEGLKADRTFHQRVMEQYLRESQMLQSEQFVTAAEEARAQSRHVQEPDPYWIPLTVAMSVLALLAAAAWIFWG
jgi:anti-sigma factor RsiW